MLCMGLPAPATPADQGTHEAQNRQTDRSAGAGRDHQRRRGMGMRRMGFIPVAISESRRLRFEGVADCRSKRLEDTEIGFKISWLWFGCRLCRWPGDP